jgi:pimeloyl-ACP methyl ester carboxylesterase
VLVHGLWMGGWSMSWLAHALRDYGFDVHTLSYDSVRGSLENHLHRLSEQVGELRAEGRSTHLVGHSMGGAVILRYLNGTNGASGVGRAVLLGTPARGSRAALEFERQPWGHWMLGESRELWGAPFPEAIESEVEVGAIAGNEPFGLGSLFVSLPGANDGVVTVDETRIVGLRDHRVLPVSHSGMLLSRDVADQAARFLLHGRFEA